MREKDWAFFQDFLGDAQPPYTPEEMQRYIEAWSQPRAATAMIELTTASRCGTRWATSVPSRRRPSAIWGGSDRFLGPDLAEPHHEDVPNLDRVERLPDASHWVHHDEAERVNQLLVDFFGPASVSG